MRKILSAGVVFAGFVSIPFAVSPSQSLPVPKADHRDDPRLQALKKFFDRCDCPVSRYSEHFLEAADSYHLDWRLLPSISFVESTGGKYAVDHNLFGWDSGRAKFATTPAAIHRVGYRLGHSSLYRGKGVDELLATYNPNADYRQKVKTIMRRISPVE
jgi:hypothetical protein